MTIKIHQLPHSHPLFFRDYDYAGEENFAFSNYSCVYTGTVPEQSLEDIFCLFNQDLPSDFTGHSLSVSDIVEVAESSSIAPGLYFCNTIGWKKVAA